MASFTFTNSTGLTTFVGGSQQLAVAGITGTIEDVSVTLTGLSADSVYPLSFLLVGPDGKANLEFFSNVGDTASVPQATITVTDSAVGPLPEGLPNTGQVASGSYRPADYGPSETNADFGSVVPQINHAATNGSATFASAFAGGSLAGTYSLYVHIDPASLADSFTAWSVSITTTSDVASLAGSVADDTVSIASTSSNAGSFIFNGGSSVGYADVTSFRFAGADGSDTFAGGDEADRVTGGGGDDTLAGGSGDDLLKGGNNNDTLDGGDGADKLRGASGADHLSGGFGADRLNGGSGADALDAGHDAERDTFV